MNIKQTFLLLIGGVILLLGSCGGSFLAEEETGGLTLSFLVPSYGEYTDSQARIIDPQSETIVLYLNDVYYASEAFTPPSSGTETYDVTFQVPVRTFSSIQIDILDGAGTLLTTGYSAEDITVTSDGSATLSLTCVPSDEVTEKYTEEGEVLSGSVEAGRMKYYSALLLTGSYDVVASNCEIYVLEEDGTILVDGLTGTNSFVLDEDMEIFVGLYNGTAGTVTYDDFEISYAGTSYDPDHLIFTEITRYAYDNFAFEIYNPTLSNVDLNGWTVWGQCWEDDDWGWTDTENTYTFWESVVVPAGEYIVISEYGLSGYYSNTNALNGSAFDPTEKVLNYYYLNNAVFSWGWADGLMVELRDDIDASVDFVALEGEKVIPEITAWRWKFGSVVDGFWWYYFDHYYDTDTVARKTPLKDSDSAMDWEAAYGTLGSPNDIGGTQNVNINVE